MEKIEKSYIKDKSTGTYEPLDLEEKVNAELRLKVEKPEEDQEDAVDKNVVERKESFGK